MMSAISPGPSSSMMMSHGSGSAFSSAIARYWMELVSRFSVCDSTVNVVVGQARGVSCERPKGSLSHVGL